ADRRDEGVPRPDGDREVERGDDADRSERVPGLEHAVVGPLAREAPPAEASRQTDGEIGEIDHLLDLAFALREDLPALEGDQATEGRLVLAEEISDLADELAAPGGWKRSPGLELPFGGLDRGVRVLDPSEADPPERLAGRRV